VFGAKASVVATTSPGEHVQCHHACFAGRFADASWFMDTVLQSCQACQVAWSLPVACRCHLDRHVRWHGCYQLHVVAILTGMSGGSSLQGCIMEIRLDRIGPGVSVASHRAVATALVVVARLSERKVALALPSSRVGCLGDSIGTAAGGAGLAGQACSSTGRAAAEAA
jgi:hypothetical protein